MFKKYSNKKYLVRACLVLAGFVSLAALVGYEKACPPSLGSYGGHGQEQALQVIARRRSPKKPIGEGGSQGPIGAKLKARTRQNSSQKLPVRKLIKVDIQPPFAQRIPAYRHSKRVYNQVTPKKRVARQSNFDDLERLALESQADSIKPDTKKTKPESGTTARPASYNSSGYNSNYSQSYNQPYNQAYSTSPVSTSSWSGAPTGSRPQAPRSRQMSSQATPRAHAPVHGSAPAAYEHPGHDSGSRAGGGGQSRPSIAEQPAKAEQAPAQAKLAAKKTEDKKSEDKKEEREFNPSAAKPKPTRPQKEKPAPQSLGGVGSAEPTLEDILNNHAQSGNITDSEQGLSQAASEPSFTDKFKASVQSLVELLVTVSMVKNGWDYVKQACDWLESTFGIGKWVRSLLRPSEGLGAQGPAGSGPQPEDVSQATAQGAPAQTAPLAEIQTPVLPLESSDNMSTTFEAPAAFPADNSPPLSSSVQ